MTALLDLLCPYPILENLTSCLTLGDLFNLSKVNSAYRAALHGFGKPVCWEYGVKNQGNLRPGLLIGAHRTRFWENLKSRSRMQCSEPQHKRGTSPRGCHICSMPVCEACIIKASFALRNDDTFQKRHRPLCSDCWNSGNHHRLHLVSNRDRDFPRPYPDRAAHGEFCLCTAKDGILCLKCRTNQNAKLEDEMELCFGQGCPNGNPKSTPSDVKGRVCLWCSRQLPGSRSRAESRRDYDARHLFARSHTSYDRPPEEEDLDTFEEQRMLELDALSRRKQEILEGGIAPTSAHLSSPEEENSEVKKRVEYAAHAREAKMWQRSEATRRQNWPSPLPPLRNNFDLPRFEDIDDQHTATNNDLDPAFVATNHPMKSTED